MEMLELAAELKWCREQIAAYEVEREQMQQYYRRAIADRDETKATISRLREYAVHKEKCFVRAIGYNAQGKLGSLGLPCNCGYDELIRSLEEKP